MSCDVKVYAENLEQEAQVQIDTLANFEAFEGCKVRIMPDAHAGAGCVIGFTANLGEKVVPNLVGVDIGCGMLAAQIDPVESFEALDEGIKRYIPSGFGINARETVDTEGLGLVCFESLKNVDRLNKSMGTLGGGNHFIEVDVDEGGNYWLVIHTGSRNLGLQVANHYQELAARYCSAKAPKGLEFLTGELAEDYLYDMAICQAWAEDNRDRILLELHNKGLIAYPRNEFHTVHNYIGIDGIIRKGAVSARKGEPVLIPFNMRDGAIIGDGKGNEDWNYSAPHGAGRIMSRRKAKRALSLDEFREQMAGVYTTTATFETLDEAPMAYKPAQEIIDLLEPAVSIKSHLKPLYNFKAVE